MKNYLVALFTIFLSATISGQADLLHSVFFDSDESNISKNEMQKLDEFWVKVQNQSIHKISILGNTDSAADSLYNITLSKNRCLEVRDFFYGKNVSRESFTIKFNGENKPLATNSTDDGKLKNRRVDIRITVQKSAIAAESKTELVIKDRDPCLGVDTTIVLDNGTELVFNKCEYEEIKDCLSIQSVRTAGELQNSNIQLVDTNYNPLNTCGMISLCISPYCNTDKKCFDNPVAVRFPFPDGKAECIPCDRRAAQVYNISADGTWEVADRKDEKIKIVTVKGKKYYQLEIECSDCGGMKNCDCPRCDQLKRWQRKRQCPNVKMKLPKGYQLTLGEIFIDCPTTILRFAPDSDKFIKRKNKGKTSTKCYGGDHMIRVQAIDPEGQSAEVELQQLSGIRHRNLFSGCKGKGKDKQRVLGVFPTRNRPLYRKYKIRKRDFKTI